MLLTTLLTISSLTNAHRYGPVEENSESAVNILIDVVKARKQVKMDDWSPRYPTNVQDVARVLLDIGDLCQCVLRTCPSKAED